MLLKTGYRYVYISRKFAMRNGFIPQDAAPGNYGYSGLVKWVLPLFYLPRWSPSPWNVSIGKWPVTVGKTKTTHAVYLSEESHFDVVLGRSFMEKRQVKTNPIDPTDIVCLDTGEKLDCELVILKDGKGEIVTVTWTFRIAFITFQCTSFLCDSCLFLMCNIAAVNVVHRIHIVSWLYRWYFLTLNPSPIVEVHYSVFCSNATARPLSQALSECLLLPSSLSGLFGLL